MIPAATTPMPTAAAVAAAAVTAQINAMDWAGQVRHFPTLPITAFLSDFHILFLCQYVGE